MSKGVPEETFASQQDGRFKRRYRSSAAGPNRALQSSPSLERWEENSPAKTHIPSRVSASHVGVLRKIDGFGRSSEGFDGCRWGGSAVWPVTLLTSPWRCKSFSCLAGAGCQWERGCGGERGIEIRLPLPIAPTTFPQGSSVLLPLKWLLTALYLKRDKSVCLKRVTGEAIVPCLSIPKRVLNN